MNTNFTDEQVVQMIKEQEAGERTADVFRRYRISHGTFSDYGGIESGDYRSVAVSFFGASL